MKYVTTSLAVLLCFLMSSVSASDYSAAAVSFYETPLVCGAAPDIGCGSRAKPMLLDLMGNSRVLEAWLNRTGTVVAVVWKEGFLKDSKRTAIIRKYAKRYDMEFVQVANHNAQFASFTGEDRWYKGDAVDALSIEEAGVIADTVVNRLLREKIITQEHVAPMRSDVEAYFKTELVKYRTKGELYEFDTQYQWHDAIRNIGEKYIGKGNMPTPEEMMGVEVKKETSCKKKKGKASCCED